MFNVFIEQSIFFIYLVYVPTTNKIIVSNQIINIHKLQIDSLNIVQSDSNLKIVFDSCRGYVNIFINLILILIFCHLLSEYLFIRVYLFWRHSVVVPALIKLFNVFEHQLVVFWFTNLRYVNVH